MVLTTILTAAWLLVLSALDIRKRNVPVWLLLPGGVMAVILAIYRQYVVLDIVKGALPGILLLATALITKKAGYGDGAAMLFLGILSVGKSMLILAVSLFLAAVVSLVLLAARKAGRNTKIPFLPFLTAGWLLITVC